MQPPGLACKVDIKLPVLSPNSQIYRKRDCEVIEAIKKVDI